MATQTFLSDFQIQLPRYQYDQIQLNHWISARHQKSHDLSQETAPMSEKLFDRYAVKESVIKTRFLELSEAQSEVMSETDVYHVNRIHPRGMDIESRTYFFSKRANEIFEQFYFSSIPSRPDHLIHVTCTGYISPSPAQIMVARSEWTQPTNVTHAYHMGCYASLPAVRMAEAFVSKNSELKGDYQVDIVHTEMCSLHMNTLSHTPEQAVVQTLFADGHIKYTARTTPSKMGRSLKVLAVHEFVVPDSVEDMSWIPTSWGMQMTLSREVPAKIKNGLKEFLQNLLSSGGYSIKDLAEFEFAIHPGGPKIIDAVRETLDLDESKISHSRKILFERGNMSSATLPHVWDSILKDSHVKSGKTLLSLAFGPGLTMFGSLMEICE